MSFVIVSVVFFVLTYIAVAAVAYIGSYISLRYSRLLAPTDKLGLLQNVRDSAWLGRVGSTEKPKDIAPRAKWKFDSYTDVNGNVHFIDKYPQFSLRMLENARLIDASSGETVLPESVHAQGISLYETLPTGEFRFRFACPPPLVSHPDIPWYCFQDPCSAITKQSHYSDANCDCAAPFTNAVRDDKRSACVPTEAAEYYDEQGETLQLRIPCWSGSSGVANSYPCDGQNDLGVATTQVRLRLLSYNVASLFGGTFYNDLENPSDFRSFR